MSVALMLKGKGDFVITAKTSDTLSDVAKVLAEKSIGAVVVLDEHDKLGGIVSERDIIRALAADGADAYESKVPTYMTKDVVSCARDDTANSVMAKMTDGRFRHMPVLEGEKLVGIISVGDVVKNQIEQVTRESEEMKRYINEAHA